MNTVLTYINESVTIVVENGHENPEVLAGARRIGRFLQLRSGRCPLSATAGGLVPLDDTMLSSRRIRHALDSETFEARQAPAVEMPHRRQRRLAEVPREEQLAPAAATSPASPGTGSVPRPTPPGQTHPPPPPSQKKAPLPA